LDSLQDIVVALACKVYNRPNGGVGLRANLRAEATYDFAMNHRVAQSSFSCLVVTEHVGTMEKDEQSQAVLLLALEQSLSLRHLHVLIQQSITIVFQLGYPLSIDDSWQLLALPGQPLRAQQQLLHTVGPSRPFGTDTNLKITQLMGVEDLMGVTGGLALSTPKVTYSGQGHGLAHDPPDHPRFTTGGKNRQSRSRWIGRGQESIATSSDRSRVRRLREIQRPSLLESRQEWPQQPAPTAWQCAPRCWSSHPSSHPTRLSRAHVGIG